jgi:LacI family transcriptional regulator
MDKKVTIRDVAEKAGVSISSVHLALCGKAGVSDETRVRVRNAAQELGYTPNASASSLKRGARRIAILVPTESGNNRYYYTQIWRGVHDYINMGTANLVCTELPFDDEADRSSTSFVDLRRMVEEDRLDGLLAVGHIDRNKISEADWACLEENEIPIVFINSANPYSKYFCCVQPDYDIIGRTMAELVTSHIPEFGSIFLCAGNPDWASHTAVVRGFERYLHEHGRTNRIYMDHMWTIDSVHAEAVLEGIQNPDVAACCSVYSQGTFLLGQALEASGKAQRLFAVGSDLSEETLELIRRGVLNNSIQKNPYAQGYIGVRTLVEYLVSGKKPEDKTIYVGSEVVFASNLTMYEHGRYHYHFF